MLCFRHRGDPTPRLALAHFGPVESPIRSYVVTIVVKPDNQRYAAGELGPFVILLLI